MEYELEMDSCSNEIYQFFYIWEKGAPHFSPPKYPKHPIYQDPEGKNKEREKKIEQYS